MEQGNEEGFILSPEKIEEHEDKKKDISMIKTELEQSILNVNKIYNLENLKKEVKESNENLKNLKINIKILKKEIKRFKQQNTKSANNSVLLRKNQMYKMKIDLKEKKNALEQLNQEFEKKLNEKIKHLNEVRVNYLSDVDIGEMYLCHRTGKIYGVDVIKQCINCKNTFHIDHITVKTRLFFFKKFYCNDCLE